MTEVIFKYLDEKGGKWFYKSLTVKGINILLANQKIKEYCNENNIISYKVVEYKCQKHLK